MPTCIAIQKDNVRCSHQVTTEGDRCGVHEMSRDYIPSQPCCAITHTGENCTKKTRCGDFCWTHILPKRWISGGMQCRHRYIDGYDLFEIFVPTTHKCVGHMKDYFFDTYTPSSEGAWIGIKRDIRDWEKTKEALDIKIMCMNAV